jgi:cytoskeleton protein RodZ
MPQGPPPQTVGARLREARERRGVSLRQIANSTRISVMSLEALERSDLARLPGGIFTRSFIRAYAQEVGLDPDSTIQDFLAETPLETATAASRPAAVEDSEKLESDRQAVSTAIRLVLISIPIVAAVIYFSTHRSLIGRSRMAVQPAEPPSAAEPARSPSEMPYAQSDAAPAAGVASLPPAVPPSGLMMEIAPKAACWVSVRVDGDSTFSILMKAGEKRQVSAREEVLLTVGDAGAFVYTLNGAAGKPLGAPGEVVSKRITLSNYKDLVTP